MYKLDIFSVKKGLKRALLKVFACLCLNDSVNTFLNIPYAHKDFQPCTVSCG